MENGEILVSSWGVPPPFPCFSPKSRESTACGLDGIVMFQYHSFGGDFSFQRDGITLAGCITLNQCWLIMIQ